MIIIAVPRNIRNRWKPFSRAYAARQLLPGPGLTGMTVGSTRRWRQWLCFWQHDYYSYYINRQTKTKQVRHSSQQILRVQLTGPGPQKVIKESGLNKRKLILVQQSVRIVNGAATATGTTTAAFGNFEKFRLCSVRLWFLWTWPTATIAGKLFRYMVVTAAGRMWLLFAYIYNSSQLF